MFASIMGMESLPLIQNARSRAINAENPTGEKGKGGMSDSILGPSRKGSPCIPTICLLYTSTHPREVVLL